MDYRSRSFTLDLNFQIHLFDRLIPCSIEKLYLHIECDTYNQFFEQEWQCILKTFFEWLSNNCKYLKVIQFSLIENLQAVDSFLSLMGSMRKNVSFKFTTIHSQCKFVAIC